MTISNYQDYHFWAMTPKITPSPSFSTQVHPLAQKSHPLTLLFLAVVGVGIGILYIHYTQSLKHRVLTLISESTTHLQQSQYSQALQKCKDALACQPREANLLARIHLIMSYASENLATEGNYTLAENSLSKAENAQPKDLKIQNDIRFQRRNLEAKKFLAEGNRHFKIQRYKDAARSYKQGFAQNPVNEALYQTLHAYLSRARGEKDMQRRLWDEAMAHFETGLNLRNRDPDTRAILHVRMGNAYVEKKDYASAETSYLEAQRCNSNKADIQALIQTSLRHLQAKKLVDQGYQKYAAKEHADALQYYDQACQLNPSQALQVEISHRRVECLIDLGQQNLMQRAYDQALHTFQRALRCNPTDVNALALVHVHVGIAQSRLELYPFAEESFSKALECKPNEPDIQEMIRTAQSNLQAQKMLWLGLQKANAHQYKDALQNYETALACKPSFALQNKIHARIKKCKIDELIYQGQQNLRKKDYALALQNFKEALAYNPSDIHDQVSIYSEMGNAHLGLQQYLFAEHCFLLAANFKPTDRGLQGQIYYQLGKYYNEKPQADHDQAFLYLSEALRFDFPQKMVAMATRGILNDHHKKDPIKAAQDYQTVIDSTGENGPHFNPLLGCMARLLKANALRRQALASEKPLSSNLETVLQEIHLLSVTAAKMDQSVHNLKIETYYQKALCHHALNQLEDAAKFYTSVIDLAEHDYTKASALCDRALCYEKQNKVQEALRDYEQALKYDLKEDQRVDSQTLIDRAPLKPLPGTPASYQNTQELLAAISTGQKRVQEKLTQASASSAASGSAKQSE
ncbi:MAG: tetratricopeptide repeat protein [Verrucomicrobia bacterium]|nr:tetratricopeptide repeat protein [Verrucomicrobiota bacterium]